MSADKPPPKTPEELISRIQEGCREGGPYIFRGTNCVSEGTKDGFDRVSSSIYRKYKEEEIFNEHFQPIDIERDIVNNAGKIFSSKAEIVEILTDLRHFSGDTTLIDFSHSLFVALFFACNGEHEKPGELIVFRTDGHPELKRISYQNHIKKIAVLRPARTPLSRARVEFQSSVFVHAPEGYIPGSYYEPFVIPRKLKKQILEFLQEFHNISEDTIYNDLIGFIQNRKNFETPGPFFYRGLAAQEAGKYEDAIRHYDAAIRLKPDLAEAYNNLGHAKVNLGRYEEAIEDCSKAILLKPNLATAYFNRGNAKKFLRKYKEAIVDYDKAIELNPDLAVAYSGRGNVKLQLGCDKEAIIDYDAAIQLKLNTPDVYFFRGVAKMNLFGINQARGDFEMAFKLSNERGDHDLAAEAQRYLVGLND